MGKQKLHIPLIQNLVVCTLWDTIEIFFPTNLFIRVDLPELGTPTKLTKPDFELFFFKITNTTFGLLFKFLTYLIILQLQLLLHFLN